MSNTRKEKVGCFVIARNCYCGYLRTKMFSFQFLVCVRQNSVPLGWSMDPFHVLYISVSDRAVETHHQIFTTLIYFYGFTPSPFQCCLFCYGMKTKTSDLQIPRNNIEQVEKEIRHILLAYKWRHSQLLYEI